MPRIWAETKTPRPRGSTNRFGMSFRFGSAGTFSKMSFESAAIYGPSSRMIASNGGFFGEATTRDTVSTAREGTRFTCFTPDAFWKAGTRMPRGAVSHAPK